MAAGDIKYAGFPSAVVYDNPKEDKKAKSKPIQHLLWGDWIRLLKGETKNWQEVHARGHDGWMRKNALQDSRLLEFVFLDVNQGDGCIITTPDDKQIIVDAGQEDNMYRFLKWRFGKFRNKFTFQTAILTHPDQDHYYGFRELFNNKNVLFEYIFHNGIFPRDSTSASKSLGAIGGTGKKKYLLDIVEDSAALSRLPDKKRYTTMLKRALASNRVKNIKMLSKSDGYLPGYEAGKALNIRVLGPVIEPDAQNKPRLRWFGDAGKTKNGHSIIIMLKYKNVRAFLGGDLNSESENFLLEHYTGSTLPPDAEINEKTIKEARKYFESDVCKSCHHGSSDFTSLLLKAINPIATVISSGDNEPYSHPRADALGTIGKFSRGGRPLIFSTELARSPNENIKSTRELKEELEKTEIKDTMSEEKKKKTREARNDLINKIGRSIAVYGAINVRTDGNDVMIAQKIEKPLRKDKEWDIYMLKRQADGELQYQSKYR